MTEADVYTTLTEIFRDVFLREDLVLSPTLAAKDVKGWDSFKQIEIVMAVEELYGIKFKTRELDALENVGDLADLILRKGVATA